MFVTVGVTALALRHRRHRILGMHDHALYPVNERNGAIGTALIWVPVGLFYLAKGVLWKSMVVVLSGIAAAITENVLRPIVVGDKTEMSFLWLTFSILGGVQMFGIMGLLLGPLIFALLPILFEIYRQYVERI